MDMSTPTAAQPQGIALVEQWLELARSGQWPLPQVMEAASRLQAAGALDAAALLYQSWVGATASPLRHVACFNWGAVLGELRRHDQAEGVYRMALALAPTFAQARLNLGHQLEHQGREEEALAEWRTVYDDEKPESVGAEPLSLRLHAFNNAARLLEQLKRYDESEALMRRSLELDPRQSDVAQHYVHIRQKQCAWPVYQTVGEVTHNHLLMSTSLLGMLDESDDPALQLLTAQRFVLEKVTKVSEPPLHKGRKREGKIRIGYLSGDLHMHAVGLLTAELYELHDKSRFEIHAFSWSKEDGTPLRVRIKAAMDHYHPLHGVPERRAAEMIAEAGIDVLVDLQGLTSGARPGILAYRGAPVQVSYLGLPATSALPGVDWILADRFVMPPESLPYHTEKPIYLPHCYQVSDRTRAANPAPSRAEMGLPQDAFVFCAFNNNHKMSEPVWRCWMRVLRQVPKSVLWLLADNPFAQANLTHVAAEEGITPERLVFAGRAQPADYLARFTLADLFLDTFPYNAGTTASDCLWMGTPILTRSGRTYISRMAGSLLTAVGLPDLITTTLEEYEQRAVQIGNQPARAASYKRYLAEYGHSSPLFDIPAIVRDIEHEFERLALEARAKA
ncbi:putative O-linked N-acetylglucosamine transferase (SPINDLY family) [Pelomonas saccharophila]|uniref:protein O-GlcNAc transferase n=1 Tax=Roseateles saccharophilus TaxID=304 RepID=A0ABU1YTL2_ROSSA|nr:acetylglucosamine transferase [Roseateles saccharophilus]MDR7272190.1 putative O-linked N-acetylglucosamine transferase (SPINDLY family) [Roseateles saccharophilus]